MKLPFMPTWEKVASYTVGFKQFHYLCDKDIHKEWKKAGLDKLNEGRKMAVRFYQLSTELNNGGLDQYFWNASGDFAPETISDLHRIGQDQAADLLNMASDKLFGRTPYPSPIDQRREAIIAYYGTHPFNDDDDAERIKIYQDKENVEAESRALYDLQHLNAIALVQWMRANATYFSHIRQ